MSSIYEGLSDDAKSMRILYLAPSNSFGHISITSRLVDTTWDKIEYEALSYCWGKSSKRKTILLNGEEFRVTTELHDALTQLCLPDRSRALWIDAICINQNDQNEKGIQVQRMQDIYRNAVRVLSWIGQSDDQTELAFAQVQKLVACTDAEKESEIWNEPGEWIACLNEIIKRPYWYRAWTVQEVVLPKTALLCCGSHSMPFFDFAQFLLHQETRKHIKAGYALTSYLELVFEMRKPSHEDPPLGLFALAYKLRHRQCTVSHDRVYAFLGLLKSNLPEGQITVDYTMDTEKLWMRFTKDVMSTHKTLLPIALAENARLLDAYWCYNWSTKAREPNDILHDRILFWTGGLDSPDYYPLQSPLHSAAAGLPARVQVDLEAPSVISVQGFRCSKIVKTGGSVSSFTIGFGRPNYVQLFEEWEKIVGGPWEDPEMTSKFAHTVTGGAWTMEPANWRVWNNRNYSEKAWSIDWWRIPANELVSTGYSMSRHDERPEDETFGAYYRVRDDACEARRIFLLENGDFGLGPEEAKVGDEVVVLLGCQVPLVLHKREYRGFRKLADLENKAKLYKSTWKVIGQAYVHSAMKYQGDLEQDINSGKVVLQDYLLD